MTRSPCLLLEQHEKPTAIPPTKSPLRKQVSLFLLSCCSLLLTPITVSSIPPRVAFSPSLSIPCLPRPSPFRFHVTLRIHTEVLSTPTLSLHAPHTCHQASCQRRDRNEAEKESQVCQPTGEREKRSQELSVSLCHFSQSKTCLLEKISFILEAE